jgi:hypothetical protein
MIKKLHFFGCSLTAGNELWEEQHVPNYSTLTFVEARKVAKGLVVGQTTDYNYNNSYPALTARELDCDFKNHGIPGISNKEIAGRAIAHFPEDRYDGLVAFLQLSTHNRVFLRYKEIEQESVVGSFVVMAKAEDDRLSKGQNNLLKEMFFEFYNESILAQDDHIYMYYAADVLRKKGINTYILWPSVEVVDWSNWDLEKKCDPADKPIPIRNDIDPQYTTGISRHIANRHHEFNLFSDPLTKFIDKDMYLPRFHFKKTAHDIVAKAIAERLKNV